MDPSKNLSQKCTGILSCLIFGFVLALSGFTPSYANTSANHLKNIDIHEYAVLLQNFTAEELLALDSMVTAQEIDQLVAMIENPYEMLNQDSDRPMYSIASGWRPNGCTASPEWIGRAHFTPSCNRYDACYVSFSRTNRLDCDLAFRANLQAECKRVYSGNQFMACIGVSNTYYGVVRKVGWAFYRGQGANN